MLKFLILKTFVFCT